MQQKIIASRVHLTVEIYDGSGGLIASLPAREFRATYPVSSIPEAVVTLPAGISLPDGIYATASQLALANPWWLAKVYVELLGEEAPGKPWPPGRHLLFEGFIHSVAYSADSRSMGISLRLRHWLTVFYDGYIRIPPAGSTVSSDFQDAQLNMIPAYHNSASDGGRIARTDHGHALSASDPAALFQDLWGCVIRPFLLGTHAANVTLSGQNGSESDNMFLRYAGRIHHACFGTVPPGTTVSDLPPLPSRYITSLTLRFFYLGGGFATVLFGCPDGGNIVGWIMNTLIRLQISSAVSSPSIRSTWDALVALQQPFLYMIVPRPSDALVVPFNPVQGCPYLTLEPDEVFSVRSTTDFTLPQNFTGLGFVSMPTGEVGFAITNPSCFIDGNPPQVEAQAVGQRVISFSGPFWLEKALRIFTELDDLARSTLFSSIGNFNFFGYVCNLPAALAYTLARRSVESMALAYGQFSVAEVLARTRTMHVTTRLRFDIAPGAMVQVNPPSSALVASDPSYDPQKLSMLGMVRSVSYTIASGGGRGPGMASTTLELGYVRNLGREADDKVVFWAHPFYMADWPGAPLIEGPW